MSHVAGLATWMGGPWHSWRWVGGHHRGSSPALPHVGGGSEVSFARVLKAHTRSPAQGRPGARTTGQSLPGRRARAPLGVQSRAGSGVASLLTEGRRPGARVWAGGGPVSGNAGGPVVPYFVVIVHTASGEAAMIIATGPGRSYQCCLPGPCLRAVVSVSIFVKTKNCSICTCYGNRSTVYRK